MTNSDWNAGRLSGEALWHKRAMRNVYSRSCRKKEIQQLQLFAQCYWTRSSSRMVFGMDISNIQAENDAFLKPPVPVLNQASWSSFLGQFSLPWKLGGEFCFSFLICRMVFAAPAECGAGPGEQMSFKLSVTQGRPTRTWATLGAPPRWCHSPFLHYILITLRSVYCLLRTRISVSFLIVINLWGQCLAHSSMSLN